MVPNDEEILTITQSVLNQMVELDAILDASDKQVADGQRMTGCVQISGAWQGAVLIQTSVNFVREAAVNMLQIKHDDVTPTDLQDVLAEITNMIGGNIKSQVPGPSYLSIPSVTAGQDFQFHLRSTHVISETPMVSADEPLHVLMCESDEV